MEYTLSSEDLAAITHQNSEAVVVTDTDGVIVYANKAMAALTGYEIDELIGRTPSVFQSGKTPREVYDEMWRTIRSGRTWRGRIINKRKATLPVRIAGGKPGHEAGEYWAMLTITPVLGPDGTTRFFAASQRDITEKVALEERLAFEREEANARADIWAILHEQVPIESKLSRALERIVRLKDIDVEDKCGIFIKNEHSDKLDLFVVHGNFTEEFLTREKTIPLGNCLCGRAAVSGEVIVSDDCFCDERHENTFVGMTRHGHYILPLKCSGEIVGVLFLYTAPYPIRARHRIDTLKSIADSLAIAIVNDRIEKQLIEARDAARASSEAKSAFLANMSHEIRTPLNGILGFTEMLIREGESISAEERREWITTIYDSGRHLLQLINNILDLSKVEAGQLDIEMIETSPVELLTDLMSTMRIQAREKNISLDLLCQGPQPGKIRTDPTRLRQILTNLIGNGLKFTERGGVSVRSYIDEMEDGQALLRIDVSDTGTGIPPEKLETIFDPFTQADNSITRRFGGTGLGLAISKRLAETLGGTLTVWSQPGRGSTFTLSLPIGQRDEIDIAEDHHTEALRSKRLSRVEDAAADRTLAGRVLLVDDGETNRRLIRRILERAGLDVTCAVNGKNALDILEHDSFDLILMDMQMPVLDGYSATKAVRQRGITTPVLALTASAMKGDRERCLAAGCSDYLTKPIDIRMLLEACGHWIGTPASDSSDDGGEGVEARFSALSLDDPELRSIVEDYIHHLAIQLKDVENALAEHDFDSLQHLAHAVSGTGGMVGFDELTRIAGELERASETKQLEEVERAALAFKREADRIFRGMEIANKGQAEADPA